MELSDLLEQMDRAAANLSKLESVWERAQAFIPEGPALGSPVEYDDLGRAWSDLIQGLPPIDGWTITEDLPDVAAIGEAFLEYAEIGEPPTAVWEEATRPERDLRDYRYRLNTARRRATRRRLEELMAVVDAAIAQVVSDSEALPPNDRVESDHAQLVVDSVAEIDRLMGAAAERTGRWSELRRHLHFGEAHDWTDIATFDWPTIRPDIEAAGFADTDPLPVAGIDLGEAAGGTLTGSVTTALDWSSLDDEGFERLLFNLLRAFDDHSNVKSLTKTNAPDRARDLSFDRRIQASTGLVRNERVLVQAKHWLTKSVSHHEIAQAVTTAEGWTPSFDVVIVATSGRFTTEAVNWADKRSTAGKRPDVELWPDSELEALLARHPGIAIAHGLMSREPDPPPSTAG